MQLLGKDPRTHRRAIYNSNTTSSTFSILVKCAARAAEVVFRFSTSVVVNSAAFLLVFLSWFAAVQLAGTPFHASD